MNTSIQHPNKYSTIQIKATLHHLNGQQSEMSFSFPKYSQWGELVENAFGHVRDHIFYMAGHWVQISHFELRTVIHKPDGKTAGTFFNKTIKIPLGKVYDATSRAWLNQEDAVALHCKRSGMPE